MKFSLVAATTCVPTAALIFIVLPFSATAAIPSSTKESDASCTPCPEPYANLMFSELSSDAVYAALDLGFTAEAWNAGMDTYATMLDWDELEDYQQQAAFLLLGCSGKSDWNCEDVVPEMTNHFPPSAEGSDCVDSYQFVGYAHLPPDIRSAAHVLGYTSDSWNAGLETPTTALYNWDQLDAEEKDAAHLLGCPTDGGNWDE
eukprot:CAMPEP_0172412292 /NCGR_PEP_ID=MMETSP1061-20121228/77827_1 /TAXON_ID=37318 /ORGANISM="Pseudo-nitzschia pungens, Strain cf. pungens" /LENGTH=201 /DNA_ID=CAMNT_0013148523 /DNA_START=804 /DNA_END=1409 /DNA_ORIENTATION=-